MKIFQTIFVACVLLLNFTASAYTQNDLAVAKYNVDSISSKVNYSTQLDTLLGKLEEEKLRKLYLQVPELKKNYKSKSALLLIDYIELKSFFLLEDILNQKDDNNEIELEEETI